MKKSLSAASVEKALLVHGLEKAQMVVGLAQDEVDANVWERQNNNTGIYSTAMNWWTKRATGWVLTTTCQR